MALATHVLGVAARLGGASLEILRATHVLGVAARLGGASGEWHWRRTCSRAGPGRSAPPTRCAAHPQCHSPEASNPLAGVGLSTTATTRQDSKRRGSASPQGEARRKRAGKREARAEGGLRWGWAGGCN